MLRKDREMDRGYAFKVIDSSMYGNLSLVADDGRPYGVPLCFVRDGEILYFHCAKKGMKAECIARCPCVHITFVSFCRVPELMSPEEAAKAALSPETAGTIGDRVFTLEFASAAVDGTAVQVDNEAEKRRALELLSQKYVPEYMEFFDAANGSAIDSAAVYKIKIEKLSAKRKEFGRGGGELKWGRTE
ncbi:MAG: pyridoxamine 5'-phosphate oxidase family protein [Candidatus Limivicinus sp.]